MPTLKKKTNIAICDDHSLMRAAMATFIDAVTDFKLTVGSADGTNLLLDLSKCNKEDFPEIILLDINMPVMDGFETMIEVRKKYPWIQIAFLTMFSDEKTILKAFKLGANAFLNKDLKPHDLINALRSIRDKGYFYSDYITNLLVTGLKGFDKYTEELQKNQIIEETWDYLDGQEKEFVRLSCTDMTYNEIASQMDLSPKQVEGMRTNIFGRFNVKTRVGLAVLATKFQFAR